MKVRGRSRWSDLFGLGSVPGSEDEARDYLRRRVGLYFRVLFFIYAGIYLMVVGLVVALDEWGALVRPSRWVHAVATVGIFGVWQFTRRADRGVRGLAIADALGTLMVATGVGLFAHLLGAGQLAHDDIELVLALTQTFIARAVIVPSTAARTLGLGVAGSLPFAIALSLGAHELSPAIGNQAWLSVFEALTWLTISIGLAGLTSRVLYGLRRRVAEFARLGQYTLEQKLGEGGMGVVYRASHRMLRRPAALKLLQPDRTGARAIARFEREVQLTATLTHPNTVAIYDFGRTPDGVFYYVMEYLDGVDLDALIRKDGPQCAGRVVHILRQVAGALGEAHAAGLIHRDIKPANIVLSERGISRDFAKVVDFGLVRDLGQGPAESMIGTLQGTPLYLSPESIATPELVDGRSDLYALGAAAYFLLTGSPIFDAQTLVGLCEQHLHAVPVPPSERGGRPVPAGLEALVLACLAKRPEDRPQSADDLVAALDRLDDVAPWTPADARAWWAGRGAAIRERRTAGPADGSGPSLTLAVDPADRDDRAGRALVA
ncbi:MAG TPA: serine/threonine-protein kinase [Kofleriaceae bacterium]|nr:serine/threonine-protein kinase [Kofleriaceae bacterium]